MMFWLSREGKRNPVRKQSLSCVVARLLIAAAVTAVWPSHSVHSSTRSEAIQRAGKIESQYTAAEAEPATLDSSSTLERYLAYAAVHNPGVRAAFYRWRAQLDRIPTVTSLPDPMFTYARFIENVETRVGPQNQRFSIRQSFPWFGTLGTRGEAAFETANAAFQKYQTERLALSYEVKGAYYDYYYLGREIALTSENMKLLKYWESVARTKYKAALIAHPDVIKAQVELGKLEDRLRTVEEMLAPAAARLKAVLNAPDWVDLPVPLAIAPETPRLEKDSVLAAALTNNPGLAAITHLIEKDRAEIILAKKASYPNFTFGVDYIEIGEALNPAMAESGKDPWGFNASINVPLWFGKNKAKRNAARARYRSAQDRLEDAKNGLTARTEQVIFEYEDALRKTSLYRDGLIPKAEQSLNASYAAYQAGETDFLNVLDAQRLLLDFQLKYERALSRGAIKLAELEMLTGHELEYSQQP